MITDRDFDALAAPFDDPLCDPKGRLKAACRHCYWEVRDDFPTPERQAEAARAATEFVRAGADLLRRDDFLSIPRLIGEFAQRCRELSQPLPVPTPAGEIERVYPTLLNPAYCGWSEMEVDFLRTWLRHGEKLVRYDKWGAETDTGRKTTRQELREAMRPISHKRLDTWFDQFPKIPEREKALA